MIKRLPTAAMVLGTALMSTLGAASALAVCAAPATQLTGTALQNALSGKTVCVGPAGNRTNQEFHNGATGGALIDYKRGPGNASDPTSTVGSWAAAGSTVVYIYDVGGTFSYTVWQQTGGALDFCNGTTPVVSGATVLSGQVPCG